MEKIRIAWMPIESSFNTTHYITHFGFSLKKYLKYFDIDTEVLGYRDLAWFFVSNPKDDTYYIKLRNLVSSFAYIRNLRNIFVKLESINLAKYFLSKKINVILIPWHHRALIKACKKANAKLVLYGMDDPMIFSKEWFDFAQQCDYVLTFSLGSVKIYKEKGIKAEWLPVAVDPEYFYLIPRKDTNSLSFLLLEEG
jgi:hypothetical protein